MLLRIQITEEMSLGLRSNNNPSKKRELIPDYLNLEQPNERIAKNTRYIFS